MIRIKPFLILFLMLCGSVNLFSQTGEISGEVIFNFSGAEDERFKDFVFNISNGTDLQEVSYYNNTFSFTGLQENQYQIHIDDVPVEGSYAHPYPCLHYNYSISSTGEVFDNPYDLYIVLADGEVSSGNKIVVEFIESTTHYATVSGKVFLDRDSDNDGVNDPASNITVNVSYDDYWGLQGQTSTVTDANGEYTTNFYIGDYPFDPIDVIYQASITLPEGYQFVEAYSPVYASETTTENLISGLVNYHYENSYANFVISSPKGTISGNVTNDTDNDDEGEYPINGVLITLKNANGDLIVITTTDANGNYEFTGLSAGDYVVEEIQPAGFESVKDGDESYDGDANDNVSNTDNVIEVRLDAGEHDTDNNFVEEEPLSTISGNVSEDINNDDEGEYPIEGVLIQLKDVNGTLLSTTTTNANGNYEFTGLPSGDYVVEEIQPAGFESVKDGDESYDGDATDNVSNTDNVIEVRLDAGEHDTDNNFVEEEPLSTISGNVSDDINNDDEGEVNIASVTIELYNAGESTPIATTTTNANGNYEFTDLPAGEYIVKELQPEGYISVRDGDESYDGDATDNISNKDNIIEVRLDAGEHDTDNNFVEEKLAMLSGNVSEDINNDNEGEVNIASVTIELYNAGESTPIATTTTDEAGNYEFTDLEPGNYIVKELQPEGYISVRDGDDSADGDTNENADSTDDEIAVTLVGGEHDDNNDFVEKAPLGTISGNVSEDIDNDLNVDIPMEGVVLELYQDDVKIAETLTDAQGNYAFIDLEPGDYVVKEIQPEGYASGIDMDRSPDGDEGENDYKNDNQIPVTIVAGEHDTDNNFIEGLICTISGTILEDLDNDGIGDVPLAGVQLLLFDITRGEVPNGVTDENGNYEFTDLMPGEYIVLGSSPEGYVNIKAGDESNDGDDRDDNNVDNSSIGVVLTRGEHDSDNNFVSRRIDNGTISGSVVYDSDYDELGDGPLVDVEVILMDASEQTEIDRVTTNEEGAYIFENLAVGDYVVVQTQPFGYASVKDGDDTTDGDANDGIFNTDSKIEVTLTTNEVDNGNNFIEREVATIVINELMPNPQGVDTNLDGVYDADQDEFVELYNTLPYNVDITGWEIQVNGVTQHVFSNTTIMAQSFLIVFGGGNPQVTVQSDIASTGSLALFDAGAEVRLVNPNSQLRRNKNYRTSVEDVDSVVYTVDDVVAGVSLGRSPNIVGDFTLDTSGGNSIGIFNPDQNTLVVTLSDFTVISVGEGRLVSWITLAEINNDKFEIERSLNGTDFVKVGEVKGNGTTQLKQDYDFTDYEKVEESIVYYRLKQIDFDGTFHYSYIIQLQTIDENSITVYPTLVSNSETLNVRGTTAVDYQIFNTNGQFIQKGELDSGLNTLDISTLESGYYFIKFSNGNASRFIVE